MLIRLQELTYETLESLSDVELRDLKKEYFDKIINRTVSSIKTYEVCC